MEDVRLPVGRVSFPAACVGCGGAADSHLEVDFWRGVDLIAISYGRTVDLQAPACEHCASQARWRRIGLVFGIAASIVLGVGILVAVLGPDLPSAVLAALMLGALGVLWWGRTRANRDLDRWFGPLAILDWDEPRGEIIVGFRDPQLAAQVAVLSGREDRDVLGAEHDGRYRAHAAPVPAVWDGETPQVSYWWLGLVVGAAHFLAIGMYLLDERLLRDKLVFDAMHRVGGATLVVGYFAVIGTVFTVGGLVARAFARRS